MIRLTLVIDDDDDGPTRRAKRGKQTCRQKTNVERTSTFDFLLKSYHREIKIWNKGGFGREITI